jgi:FkbM family methyltransferase
MNYSQYGEEALLNHFFNNRTGYFIDIGAADGVTNSNTRNLVLKGWQGLLIEPCRHFFEQLNILYKNNKNVKLFNGAVSDFDGKTEFYVYESGGDSQISTISIPQKESIEKSVWFNGKFTEHYEVEVKSSKFLMKQNMAPTNIEFVDIDAEGSDMTILKAWPWSEYNVELFCIEPSMGKDVLCSFMGHKGYTNNASTDGNMFFIRKT